MKRFSEQIGCHQMTTRTGNNPYPVDQNRGFEFIEEDGNYACVGPPLPMTNISNEHVENAQPYNTSAIPSTSDQGQHTHNSIASTSNDGNKVPTTIQGYLTTIQHALNHDNNQAPATIQGYSTTVQQAQNHDTNEAPAMIQGYSTTIQHAQNRETNETPTTIQGYSTTVQQAQNHDTNGAPATIQGYSTIVQHAQNHDTN